jgi:hypothetical protein
MGRLNLSYIDAIDPQGSTPEGDNHSRDRDSGRPSYNRDDRPRRR